MIVLRLLVNRGEGNMKVKDKVFVVTGGGNGVGRELVLGLLSRGARVAAVDINGQALEETARLSGDNRAALSVHIVNVADRAAVEALPAEVIAAHGTVDGIINNAGIVHPFMTVNEMGYDMIQRVMDVNFGGMLAMTKAFLPHLLARPEAHITNVSSMGALFAVPGQTIYGASKAAAKLLTEGLRAELKGTGVRVTAVFPGGIGTDILGHSGVGVTQRMRRVQKVFKLLSPQKAAKRIINGIEHHRQRLTLGVDSTLTDMFCRISPVVASQWIYRIMKFIIQE
jgi:NAD(P)-dependent dehydrogenase (short-subunit alcohol dehydrogenase family)